MVRTKPISTNFEASIFLTTAMENKTMIFLTPPKLFKVHYFIGENKKKIIIKRFEIGFPNQT